MTCIEFQKLITPYIQGELDDGLLNQFLEHIKKCTDCKEELEVYYTLLTGMKQLDEDKNLSGDFHVDFENRLKRSEEYLLHKRIKHARKRAVFIICVISVAFFVTIGDNIIKDYSVPNNQPENYSTFKASKSLLNLDFYQEHEKNISEYVYQNYEDMKQHRDIIGEKNEQ